MKNLITNCFRELPFAKSFALGLMLLSSANTFAQTVESAKPKVWWFHGATEATPKGIHDDIKSFADAGIGGVVYYDQVHEVYGNPSPVFSADWWNELKCSAREARRFGLTFEVNISNGYVAGGPWIDADHAMQRIAVTDTIVESDGSESIVLPMPDGIYHDIATIACPAMWQRELVLPVSARPLRASAYFTIDSGSDTTVVRAVTVFGKGRSKSPTSAMNIPGTSGSRHFTAANFEPLPPVGELQVSDDGVTYRKHCDIPPLYGDMGWKLGQLTLSVPAVRARYFRLYLHDWAEGKESENPLTVYKLELSSEPTIDRWEEKTANRSDFINYASCLDDVDGVAKVADVVELQPDTAVKGTVQWRVPRGRWRVMRFGYVPTGAKIKHGRKGMTGYECDRLSAEAATLQYENYFKRIADSLSLQGTPPLGATADSHEAGTQNWTAGFETAFLRRNGYSIIPWLPVLRGYIIESKERSESFLKDYRRTLSDMAAENFFGTIDSLCRRDGYTFTAQAMGNGMCFPIDNIAVKRRVAKPQGEFWTYQTLGAYDVKEAASAAHIYGKPIASAEAFTDCSYGTSFEQLKSLADFALCMGVNEFVVCASPYQPRKLKVPLDYDSKHPYALNRNNPSWKSGRWFWKYLEDCCSLMRKGHPVVDICVYLGDEVPVKLLTHHLPVIPEGYDWDVCTTDAFFANGSALSDTPLPRTARYKLIAIEDSVPVPVTVLRRLAGLSRRGMLVNGKKSGIEAVARHYGLFDAEYKAALDSLFALSTVSQGAIAEELDKAGILPDFGVRSDYRPDSRIYFTHRTTDGEDIYFVYNRGDKPFSQTVSMRRDAPVNLWNPKTGRREHFQSGKFHLTLKPEESVVLSLPF